MSTPIDPSFQQLWGHIFPIELLEHFTITGIKETAHVKTEDKTIEITLEEKNTPPAVPDEHRGKNLTSKGFNHVQVVQDFPLRDCFCLLKVKTRRWEIDEVGTLRRTLSSLPESGLKLTTDFAAFLKEADRTRTGGSWTHRETVWGEET
jgi:hypothetical protein